ncbi:hypothetical protein F5Y11DRAFT_331785 [Daldinia sp. FL1419]|nr:hypothetical protein F5Y11DRAFT_331785 [Daldinia sp. FL1419]
MSIVDTINALHAEVSQTVHPLGRAATRVEYSFALEMADKAMELAIETGDESIIKGCEAVQNYCYESLLNAYRWIDSHERRLYEKSSASPPLGRKRSVRIYSSDRGEHVAQALEAVHIGNMLKNQVAVQPDSWSRRIRWVDEVKNQPIRTLVY